MQFILLKSRGGNYMVAVQNVAYLRADENGQTKVGMIGGDQLLVEGAMDEIAEKIAVR
jgi:DNA-binding LytR/AlgR family response regulator